MIDYLLCLLQASYSRWLLSLVGVLSSSSQWWSGTLKVGSLWMKSLKPAAISVLSYDINESIVSLQSALAILRVVKGKWKWKLISCVWHFVTSWTVVHGILQARILAWVAFPFSRGSSQPRDQTQVSHMAGRFFISWATKEAQEYWSG